jgi:CRISPR-associated protein Cmr3
MYDNFTPNDGQTSSSRGNLVPVTKSNPCPHCGKPDWCYSIGELSICNRDQPPAPGWEATSKADKDGKIYYAPIQQKKAIRPRQTRYWEYRARDGSPLVRVVRFDDGEGGKPQWSQQSWGKCKRTKQMGWIGGTEGIAREDIPIYRYAEIQQAIANNELIYLVEGEACADIFWKLGLAATCNIGGSGKWRNTDTSDLQGARTVIVPDRDQPGIKHAELLHQEFPEALWLYPFPESKAWENLPESKGLDIADWVEHHKITAEDIKAAIGEKKVFNAPAPTSQAAAKVLTHERFKSPSVDLRKEITALFNTDITGSELSAAFVELARVSNSNVQQVERIYKEIQEEADRDEQRLDRKSDLEELLKISSRRLTLEKYLHPNLAEPIKKVSTWMGVDPEAVLTHLLPIAAGLINPNSRIVVKECTNFVEPCLLYSAVIAETGSRKTPLLNIPKAPLVKLQAEEDARYKAELDAYQKELDAYNHRPKENKDDEPPVPPHPPREFYVDNVTVESLDEIKGCQPDKAFTMIKDELSGLFASHGAYKGGRGSDKESFLSGWGGGGVKKNRRSKDSRVSLARDSLSITGGIQPDKLRELFGDFTDAQGEWARFLWYQMPMRPYKIPRHSVTYSLGGLLESIYRKLDSLPELEFYFSKDGQNFYDDWYDKKYEQTRNETKPGLKAAMAKMPGQAARLIGVLHVLNGVSSQPPEVQQEIPLETVRAGCHLAQFYLGQVTVLQGDGDALNGELTPILRNLLEKVNDIGELNAAQAKRAVWGLRSDAPDKIRQYFNELAAMDLAEVQGTGSRLILKSKVLRNVDEKLRNVDEKLRNIDEKLRSPQPYQTYIYQEVQEINHQTVDVVEAIQVSDTDAVEESVDEFCDSEKTSTSSTLAEFEAEILTQQDKKAVEESSTISSTVEDSSTISSTLPANFAEQIRKAIANFDRLLAIQVWDGLKAKVKRKLREEVKNHLTPTENENFKLLVAAGFLRGTRVKYVGDPKYAEQYEGLELEVYSIDEHSLITCRKPGGYLTTRMKPEELEKL